MRERIVLYFIFTVVFALNIRGFFVLKKHQPKIIKKKTMNHYTSTETVNRGDILDRNGNILATTILSPDLYLDKRNKINYDKNIDKIIQIVFDNKVNKQILLEKISKHKSDLILIKKNISNQKIMELKEHGVISCYFTKSMKRIYPLSRLTSHIVGAVDFERKGTFGVEKFMDANLQSGQNITLSIDINVQKMLWESLYKLYKEYNPKNAFGIISDLHTGEIVASVSFPDFDPNNIIDVNETFDSIISGRYEFGSTMKILLYAASLENGISKKKKYNVKSQLNLSQYKINDVSKKLDLIDLNEIMKFSSNRGAVLVTKEIGIDKYKNFLSKFDFDKSINLDVIETEVGTNKKIDNLKDINVLSSSYGYGFAMTPLHFVYAANSLVNGGRMVGLTYLKRSVDDYWSKLLDSKRIISEDSSYELRNVLYDTVKQGSSRRADSKYYALGAKSGTAMKVLDKKYSKEKNFVNFYTILSAKNPRYSIFIGLDLPDVQSNIAFGSYVIGPEVPSLVNRVAPILKMTPDIK